MIEAMCNRLVHKLAYALHQDVRLKKNGIDLAAELDARHRDDRLMECKVDGHVVQQTANPCQNSPNSLSLRFGVGRLCQSNDH